MEKQVPRQQVCESISGQHFAGCRLIARGFHSNTSHSTIFIILVGVKPGSLTTKEFTTLKMFGNRILGIIFGCKRHEVTEVENSCIIRNFIICTVHHILLV